METTPLLPFVELLVLGAVLCTFGGVVSSGDDAVVLANTAGLLLLHAPILSLGLQLTLQRTDPIYLLA